MPRQLRMEYPVAIYYKSVSAVAPTWMIVIVSKHSSGSDWVRLEVDMAMGLGRMNGRIIPVQLDDTCLEKVNEYLVSMQAINARATPHLANFIANLIAEASKTGL